MLEGIVESFVGTFLAGLALLLPIAYLIKKKLGNTPMGMMFG